tara:strand:+ start:376 stop:912 length:537 start_codon:yes stop_codon:yes gene_type:complete
MNPEKVKYDKLYSLGSYGPITRYGHTNHGKPWMNHILEFQPKSLLDVGCGYNEFVKEVRENKFIEDSWGIDFSCTGADQNCDILELPFPDKRWDFITAFDVMEHLLPEQVSPSLKEMKRVSKRFSFTISFKKSILEEYGMILHPTIWPPKTWIKEIEKAGGKLWEYKDHFFIGEWKDI